VIFGVVLFLHKPIKGLFGAKLRLFTRTPEPFLLAAQTMYYPIASFLGGESSFQQDLVTLRGHTGMDVLLADLRLLADCDDTLSLKHGNQNVLITYRMILRSYILDGKAGNVASSRVYGVTATSVRCHCCSSGKLESYCFDLAHLQDNGKDETLLEQVERQR
jgi:hypothetical protein